MKIVEVIPISKAITKETLSYFTSRNPSPGSLVSVPLRNGHVNALVVSTEDASSAKSRIKSSPFALKKALDIKPGVFLLPAFVRAAQKTAEYFASTAGAVLYQLIPNVILSEGHTIVSQKKNAKPEGATANRESTTNLKPHSAVIQASDDDRITAYRSLIREEFAKNASVIITCPTLVSAERTALLISKGIEEYTYLFHSKISKKALLTLWNEVLQQKHPVLLIMTGSFLSLPRADVGTIIVDEEHSSHYKTQQRPYLDTRYFAETLAQESRIRFVLGSDALRPETLHRYKQGDYTELAPLKWRASSTAKSTIVSLVREKEKKKPYQIIGPELQALITKNIEEKKHLFLYVSRRGLASITTCDDCGKALHCPNCSAPITLHKGEGGNVFVCHKCGLKISAKRMCDSCGSWRLSPLGAGTERAFDEVSAFVPDVPIFEINADKTTTHKKGLSEAEKFLTTRGSILIGTEMSLPYIKDKVENTAIVSIDSLFSIPDFRISGKIFHTLLSVRSKATEEFLIQTRIPDEEVFQFASKGWLQEHYTNEIKERKAFGYPPFNTLIKISFQGSRDDATSAREEIREVLGDYNPDIFPAFIEKVKNRYTVHALIKLPPDNWVDSELLHLLLSLPASFSIKVDPDTLL